MKRVDGFHPLPREPRTESDVDSSEEFVLHVAGVTQIRREEDVLRKQRCRERINGLNCTHIMFGCLFCMAFGILLGWAVLSLSTSTKHDPVILISFGENPAIRLDLHLTAISLYRWISMGLFGQVHQ